MPPPPLLIPTPMLIPWLWWPGLTSWIQNGSTTSPTIGCFCWDGDTAPDEEEKGECTCDWVCAADDANMCDEPEMEAEVGRDADAEAEETLVTCGEMPGRSTSKATRTLEYALPPPACECATAMPSTTVGTGEAPLRNTATRLPARMLGLVRQWLS